MFEQRSVSDVHNVAHVRRVRSRVGVGFVPRFVACSPGELDERSAVLGVCAPRYVGGRIEGCVTDEVNLQFRNGGHGYLFSRPRNFSRPMVRPGLSAILSMPTSTPGTKDSRS